MSEFDFIHKIKILRLIARMNVGGPAFLVLGLMNDPNLENYKQILLTGHVSSNEREVDLVNRGFSLVRLPKFSREIHFMNDLRAIIQIHQAIKEFQPDIIDTHTFKAGLLGRLACLFQRGKSPIVVHHYHGHLLYGYFGFIKKKFYISIEKYLAKRTNAIVVDSRKIANELMKNRIGSDEKYVEILPGVRVPNETVLRQPKKIDEFRIGFIGRLEPIKQPHDFLEVVSILKHRNSKYKWTMVGEGSLKSVIEEDIRRRNIPVSIGDFRNDVYEVLANVDILVLTSLNEGTPLTIMEAAHFGIPSVAYDVGSVDKIIQDGYSGFVTNPTPKELAIALEKLTESEANYQIFSSNAKELADSSFGMKRYTSEHRKLYHQLLEIKERQ